MDEQPGAIIIPFPVKPRGGLPQPAEAAEAAERLATALTTLSLALTEQRDAMRRWRDSLAALANRVQGMNVPH